MNAIQKKLILCLTVCGIGLSGSAFAGQSPQVQKKGGFCIPVGNNFSYESQFKFKCKDISEQPLTIKEVYDANWRVVGVLSGNSQAFLNAIIVEQQ